MSEKQHTINAHIATERAIDELRRQMGLVIQEDNQQYLLLFPSEFLSNDLFEQLSNTTGHHHLLLTGSRGRHLGLIDDKAVNAVSIAGDNLSLEDMEALTNPLSSHKLPQTSQIETASPTQHAAINLTKYASLLPAALAIETDTIPEYAQNWHQLNVKDIEAYQNTPMLTIIESAQASLPMHSSEDCRIVSFRAKHSAAIHLAIIIGDISKTRAPLTRVHSSCVTGDILGSLRCDCGDQLNLALEYITKEGQGILLYLHQEGRGIGLVNKLRAYQLQERGMDTYEANLQLGYEEDERDFSIANAMLRALNVSEVKLLTNNPHKLDALAANGIKIRERIPLTVNSRRHNHAYLDAKAQKKGHLL